MSSDARRSVRRVVAGAMALLLCGPVAATASNPYPGNYVVVVGHGPSAGTMVVDETLRVDFTQTRIAMGLGTTYGGVVITTPKGYVYGGAYRIRAFDPVGLPPGATPPDALLAGLPKVALPPGEYRVHLLGDGPVEVRVPLDAGAGQTVRPTGPSTQTMRVVEATLTDDGSDAENSFTLEHPFRRTNRSVSVVAGRLSGPGLATGATMRTCISREAPCRHGTWAGPDDVIGANDSLTVTASELPERWYVTAGQRYAIVTVTSRRSAGATLRLGYVQVES